MIKKSSELVVLIESEIKKISDPRVLSHIQQLLVAPYEISRAWDYGQPNQEFVCWSVLEHPQSNTGIAYCEFGFGPRSPWGLVFLSGSAEQMSIGMDCNWYTSFEEAYFESKVAAELPIWRVYRQHISEEYPGVALTPEGDWDATWEEVYRLRDGDKTCRYNCSQTVQVQKE